MNAIVYSPPVIVDELEDRVAGGVLPVDAALLEACRVAVAEELRRLAVKYKTDADKERNRSIRLEASDAPKWQHESSIASAQELGAFVRDLHTRANELDPEGAQR